MTNEDSNTSAPPSPRRSILEQIFISPDEPRLRAGWRVLAQLILWGAVVFFIGFLGQFVIQLGINDFLVSLAYVLAITLSVYLARRFLDRRSFVSLGLELQRPALWDVLAGFGIAGAIIGITFLLEWAFGWLTFLGFMYDILPASQVTRLALRMLMVFILVGWQEELVFRGYQLQNLLEGTNVFVAVILSSATFSLLHLGNPSATWLSTLIIWLAGVFMAYAYLRTRRLWLPIGLHIGWNFFQSTFFGYPVSGMDDFHLILQSVEGAPNWLTGGAYGPDAGLIILPGLVLGVILVYAYSHYFPAGQTDLTAGKIPDSDERTDNHDI